MNDENYKIEYRDALMAVCRRCLNEDKYDFVNLYIQLHDEANKLIESGVMKPRSTFDVPIENGSYLIFKFLKNRTNVYVHTNQGEMFIDGARKKLAKDMIAAYQCGVRTSGYGIGTGFPQLFKDTLYSLKAGEMIEFNNGTAYVCVGNTNTTDNQMIRDDYAELGHSIVLRKVLYRDGENGNDDTEKMVLGEKFAVVGNDYYKVQDVFRSVCDPLEPAYTFKIFEVEISYED